MGLWLASREKPTPIPRLGYVSFVSFKVGACVCVCEAVLHQVNEAEGDAQPPEEPFSSYF